GAARCGMEHGCLALEAEDRTVNHRLLEHHAHVVDQVPGRKVVAAVHYQVVLPDDFERVFGGEPGVVTNNLDARVKSVDRLLCGLGLGDPDTIDGVDDLALKIREIDHVEIDQPKRSDSCR